MKSKWMNLVFVRLRWLYVSVFSRDEPTQTKKKKYILFILVRLMIHARRQFASLYNSIFVNERQDKHTKRWKNVCVCVCVCIEMNLINRVQWGMKFGRNVSRSRVCCDEAMCWSCIVVHRNKIKLDRKAAQCVLIGDQSDIIQQQKWNKRQSQTTCRSHQPPPSITTEEMRNEKCGIKFKPIGECTSRARARVN